ncbi:hypothetical protein B7P43_G07626 [Cryptotermes secundus]|uniref:GAIN-B domain-containing protein n=1 Tax=Cryptotermes secundus TaxID=105785 RepID=A0A2J7RLD8_9NEOP|nr:hypothetical protein B7P43_G07626 [Cryptotermes secundus]
MKIPTKRTSREIHAGFQNNNGNPRSAVPLQNVYVDTTAPTVSTSNSSLQTDKALVTSKSWGNTTAEETVTQYLNDITTQHTSTNTEADEPDVSYSFNITSAYEPGAGNVSAVADGDDTHFDDDSATLPTPNSSTTALPNECSHPCNGQDQYGNSWTGCPGHYVKRPCPNRALGEAKWFCDLYGNSFIGDTPDYGNCTHTWIEEVHEEISAGTDAVKIARYVQKSANHTSFFGHELQDVMEILKSTFELHMKQVVWEYPAIRLNKSAIFTSSATGIVDKLLVSKFGLQQLVEAQRVSLGLVLNKLSASVGFTLASLAADLGDNFKYNITFKNNTAVLFGVGVFDANSSVNRFVFPPEEGHSTSHITVDAGVLRRPRSVGMILDSEPAALLFPPTRNNFRDPAGQAKILNSVLISYSIQDASKAAVKSFRTRTADGAVQILLRHVKVAKGPREVVIRRRLHPGEESTAVLGSARDAGLWDEAGCRVEASDETQTRCVCSHLSTFAVLMDVHDYVVHTRREDEHRQERVLMSAWGSRDISLLSRQDLHQFLGGDLFRSGRCATLLVPSRFLLDDCRGPPPVSYGCESVRHWPRLQTLVPDGGIWSSGTHPNPHSPHVHLERRESLWEGRAVRELCLT